MRPGRHHLANQVNGPHRTIGHAGPAAPTGQVHDARGDDLVIIGHLDGGMGTGAHAGVTANALGRIYVGDDRLRLQKARAQKSVHVGRRLQSVALGIGCVAVHMAAPGEKDPLAHR